MICIITKDQVMARQFKALLTTEGIACIVVSPDSENAMRELYGQSIRAAIVDEVLASLPLHAWHDLLGSLGRRIPVFVLGHESAEQHTHAVASRNSELVHYCESSQPHEILSMLAVSGALDLHKFVADAREIPMYHSQVALHMLKQSGAVSMLTINASAFRKVAIDYGVEAYQQLQDCFLEIMMDMKGRSGCFRKTDMVMRRAPHSNTYYVFLEQSRQFKTVPAPGILESMADRISLRLQKELWGDMLKPQAIRKLPDCMSVLPDVSVGYATSLLNPCVDSAEIIEHMLESSTEASKVQVRRHKDRSRELMQTMIQSREMLYPHYQAIFNLQSLTKSVIDEANASKSIAPLEKAIFGFESLIRVRNCAAYGLLINDKLVHMEPRMMRPDLLFAHAKNAKVALELDQVCLKLGVEHAQSLPGKLMVNVLPRNLLHMERLVHLLSPRKDIVFELSESEGVSNQKLMTRIRDFVASLGCSIAADDFGKGYASIERIIMLRPEIIKLDRSLIENIHLDSAKESFVDGIVKAGKMVQSLVVAEGVELWEEAAIVQGMGVDLIQGYLCHKPQSLEVVLQQIRTNIIQEDDKTVSLDNVA
jgi:EAL domain-containing protein (putative c-di-GMP-specific phosphodiesterase class I)